MLVHQIILSVDMPYSSEQVHQIELSRLKDLTFCYCTSKIIACFFATARTRLEQCALVQQHLSSSVRLLSVQGNLATQSDLITTVRLLDNGPACTWGYSHEEMVTRLH